MTFEDNPGIILFTFLAVLVALAIGLRMLQQWDTFRRLKIALVNLHLSGPVIRHLISSYVDHFCYNTTPHPEYAVSDQPVGEAVDVLDAYLRDESSEKHCFVFGDPGVGKTAVLVKYMERNLQRRGFNRLEIFAIGMDVPRAYERIKEVPDKYDKILFIDAYQEEEVLDNHRKRRLMYLLEDCRDFRKIVLFTRFEVVSMGWGQNPQSRQRVIVRNPMRSKDYSFEVIRLQAVPSYIADYFKSELSGFGKRRERNAFFKYLAAVGPQIRYGFLIPYLPLLSENNTVIKRPIHALEPVIRIQILTFLERVTPGDPEDTHKIIMDDAPGVWNLLGWVSEEAFKTFQVRRRDFNEDGEVKTLDKYLNEVGSDYLTRAELEEIEDRLDMDALQRAAVRYLLFRTEMANYGRLRSIRRVKSEKQRNRDAKKEQRKRQRRERKLSQLLDRNSSQDALVASGSGSRSPRRWNSLWISNQAEQSVYMIANRSLLEFFFVNQVIDRVGGLSNLPLTFHMQELLLELTGIRDRLGERMELINGITAHELIDKFANPLDATESDNAHVARFILSNIKQVDLSQYDLSGYMLTAATLRGANLEETLLNGAQLSGADLQAANLKKASLRGANLSHARLDGANLEETQASGMYLHEASIRYARMDYAFLSGSWLTGADFSHSVLASGDLESVHVQPDSPTPLVFFQTDLRWANMRYSELSGTSFEQARLNSADLEQAQLQRASFKNATLVGANLALCDLQQADFHAALLEGAHLKRAKLYGANFSEAQLKGANFDHAILHNISFSGVDNTKRLDMRETLLEHANMRGAEIKYANLQGAQLNFSNMRRIRITHVNMAGASMKKALMEGAVLKNVDLTGANLERAMLNNAVMDEVITLDGAVLTGASLLNANLEGRKTTMRKAQLQQAYMYGANLSKVFLLDADLTGCNLERAKLLNTRMVGAKLIRAKLFHSQMNHVELMHANMRYSILCLSNMEDAKLNEADMTGADLRDARLLRASMQKTRLDYADCKGALFDRAILEEASLIGADLQNCVMKKVNLYGASLEDANLAGTDLRGADLSGANLKGANFTNANLEGANLTDVIIDNTTNFHGANTNGVINFTRTVEDQGRFD